MEDNGKYYIVYHARDIDADEKYETRTARYRLFTVYGHELKLNF